MAGVWAWRDFTNGTSEWSIEDVLGLNIVLYLDEWNIYRLIYSVYVIYGLSFVSAVVRHVYPRNSEGY